MHRTRYRHRAAKQRVGGRDPGPQSLGRAVELGLEPGHAFARCIRLELDGAGERVSDKAGEWLEIGDRHTQLPVDRPLFR